MAKAPSLRGLAIEDFQNLTPEVRVGMEQLSKSLSPFLADTTDALMGRLTLRENLDAIIKPVDVAMPAVASSSTGPFFDLFSSGTWVSPGDGERVSLVGGEWVWGGTALADGGLPADGTALGTVRTQYRFTYGSPRAFVLPVYDDVANRMLTGVFDVSPAGVFTIRQLAGEDAGTRENTLLISLDAVRYEATLSAAVVEPPLNIKVSLDANGKKLGALRPVLALPVAAQDVTAHSNPVSVPTPTIAWDHATDGIVIKRIQGFSPGRKYRIHLLLLG